MSSSWIEELSERATMRSSTGMAIAAHVIKAVAAVIRRILIRPRRRIRVSRVSEEWLRAFDRESSKRDHRDGP